MRKTVAARYVRPIDVSRKTKCRVEAMHAAVLIARGAAVGEDNAAVIE